MTEWGGLLYAEALAAQWPVLFAAALGPASDAGMEPVSVMYRVACFVVPAILAVPAVFLLRPLFSIFLREGAELFADTLIPVALSDVMARYLATFNIIVFVLAWWATIGCSFMEWPFLLTLGLPVLGVFMALLVTIRTVGGLPELRGRTALLVGLVTFGGGNLPLIVLLPVVLYLW